MKPISSLWQPWLLFMIILIKHWATARVSRVNLPCQYKTTRAHVILKAQCAYICPTEGSLANRAETTACSLDGPEFSLLWAFVWLHSSLEGHTRNNIRWSRSVECWSKRAPLSLSVHHHAGVVSARNMLTCQLAPFPADLFMLNLKYDLQLTSRGARIAPPGRLPGGF